MSQTASSRRYSYREAYDLLGGAQKSARRAGGYSRWINRPVGRHLAAWAYGRGMSPNQVTAISGLFTFAAIVAVAVLPLSWYLAVGVALFLMFGYALDSADGQLARLTRTGSAAGEWLDHVSDCVKCCSLHLAVLICWYRHYGLHHARYLVIPIAYTLVSTVWFFAIILSEQIRRYTVLRLGQGTSAPRSTAAPVLMSLLVLPADYGLLAVSFATLSARPLFGAIYTVLLVGNALFLVVKLRAWYVELSGLEAAAVAARS